MSKRTAELIGIDAARFIKATDRAYMADRLGEKSATNPLLSEGIGDIRISRVMPRGKGGFSIQYMIRPPGGNDRIVSGHLLGINEKEPSYARLEDRAVFFEDIGLVVPIFPFDQKLPDLPRFLDRERAGIKLAGMMAPGMVGAGQFEIGKIEVLGYRLERRCVIRYESRETSAEAPANLIVKLARRGEAPGIGQRRLASMGFGSKSPDGLTVPEIYGEDTNLGACVMEFAPGCSLHDLAGDKDHAIGCAAAGRTIRKLHGHRMEDPSLFTHEDELTALKQKFLVSAELFPEMRGALYDLYDGLRGQANSLEYGFEPATIHRDFYDKQVIFSKKRTTLLDCDAIAIGDPALDFGNFIAHLRLRGYQVPEQTGQMALSSAAFAESYGPVEPDFERRVEWWTAASLVRLACLYALRPQWRSLPPMLLEDAKMYLNKNRS